MAININTGSNVVEFATKLQQMAHAQGMDQARLGLSARQQAFGEAERMAGLGLRAQEQAASLGMRAGDQQLRGLGMMADVYKSQMANQLGYDRLGQSGELGYARIASRESLAGLREAGRDRGLESREGIAAEQAQLAQQSMDQRLALAIDRQGGVPAKRLRELGSQETQLRLWAQQNGNHPSITPGVSAKLQEIQAARRVLFDEAQKQGVKEPSQEMMEQFQNSTFEVAPGVRMGVSPDGKKWERHYDNQWDNVEWVQKEVLPSLVKGYTKKRTITKGDGEGKSTELVEETDWDGINKHIARERMAHQAALSGKPVAGGPHSKDIGAMAKEMAGMLPSGGPVEANGKAGAVPKAEEWGAGLTPEARKIIGEPPKITQPQNVPMLKSLDRIAPHIQAPEEAEAFRRIRDAVSVHGSLANVPKKDLPKVVEAMNMLVPIVQAAEGGGEPQGPPGPVASGGRGGSLTALQAAGQQPAPPTGYQPEMPAPFDAAEKAGVAIGNAASSPTHVKNLEALVENLRKQVNKLMRPRK